MRKPCFLILALAFVVTIVYSVSATDLMHLESFYTRGDAGWCIQQAKQFQVELLPLGILPGTGWDNLQNIVTGQVVAFNFSKCRTTDDGKYLIPDNSFTVAIKSSRIESFAEIIEDYLKESSSTSRSINVGASLSFPNVAVSGSYSNEHMSMKTKQIENKASTVRVSATYVKYKIELQPDPKLSEEFRNRIMDISDSIALNRSDQANYRAQTLVRDFGSHYITSIDAGGKIVKDDYVEKGYISSSKEARQSTLAEASSGFFNLFKISTKYSTSSQSSHSTSYKSHTKQSYIRAYGGDSINLEDPSAENWLKSIDKNLVTIDRMGDPIYALVTERVFPDIPSDILFDLEKTVRSAVQLYYEENTVPGCTDQDDTKFSMDANFDDGTCSREAKLMGFGGIYQTCDYSGSHWYGNPCSALRHKNPKTGQYSCPSSYVAIPLYEESRSTTENKRTSYRCGFLNTGTCHRNNWRTYRETYRSYWCAATTDSLSKSSGYLFGGLYTDKDVNPVTHNTNCPLTFIQQTMLDDMQVCVSDDIEASKHSDVPFGGFFSCQHGNPLAASDTNSTLSADAESSNFPKSCPEGFSQKRAKVTRLVCQVWYCVESGKLAPEVAVPPIRLPPFIDPPAFQHLDADQDESVYDTKTKKWRKGDEAKQFIDEEI